MQKPLKNSQVKKMDDIFDDDMNLFEHSLLDDEENTKNDSFDFNLQSSNSCDQEDEDYQDEDFDQELMEYDPYDLFPAKASKCSDNIQILANTIEGLKENIKPVMKWSLNNDYYEHPVFLSVRVNQGTYNSKYYYL